ncbi:MarR family transcriptional regulator [Rhodococcus aerolatus]
MTADPHQVGADLGLAALRLNRRLRVQRRDARVSLTQASALVTLVLGGPMTPGALAARERVQPPSMTRVIAALEQLGFIDREPHPTDRRQVIVSVSASGAEYVAAETSARDAWMDARMRELSPDDVEVLARAVALIDRMVGSDT